MNWMITALVLGILGSLHCIGMCGPIATAVTLGKSGDHDRLKASLLYHVGRVLTYALLGLLFGVIGQSFFLAGYQQLLSIALGVILLLQVLFAVKLHTYFQRWNPYSKAMRYIHRHMSAYLKQNGFQSAFTVGMLNGVLPCGLVYVALAGAAATSNLVNGMLFMVFFGLGNVPALWMLVFAATRLSADHRIKWSKVIPFFVFVMGLFLVLRGLNLGIPYVSPELGNGNNHCTVVCKPQ